MKKLLLIDTFNFIHRAYNALPKTFTDKSGNPTNAVYGVSSMLINILEQVQPNYVIAAIDDEVPTFRVSDFTGYKAQRKPPEEAFTSQIDKVYEVIDAFGIRRIMLTGYEADDVIGTAAAKFEDKDLHVIIASNDRDMWQLITPNVLVMSPTFKGDFEWIGEKEVEARFGFGPAQVIDYKGLRGDTSDNIPGVHGIGELTAKKLIVEYGTVDNVYANIGKITPASLQLKLVNGYEQAIMSRKLATIITDAPMATGIHECKYSEFNKLKVKEVFERYNFKSLIRRLGFELEPSTSKKAKPAVSADQASLF